jgi:hypothetical protein
MTHNDLVRAPGPRVEKPEATRSAVPIAPSFGGTRPAALLALLVGLSALVYAWFEQYSVDAETTLVPWLMRHGWILYTDVIDQHPPLLPWLLMPFDGDPGLPMRVFIVALRALTLLLTYAAARRLCGEWAGLVALAGAALWAIGANAAHLWYDGALAPVYLGVVLLLIVENKPYATTRDETWSALALGCLLAAAVLLKQHALVAVPGVVFALACGRPGRGRSLAAYALGLLMPLTLAALYFTWLGAGASAAYWLIAYSLAGSYAAEAGLPPPAGEAWWLILAFVPAIALILVAIAGGVRELAPRHTRLLPAGSGLLLAATLPVWPRYGRFHLEAAIPLLAVAAGITAVTLGNKLRQGRRQARLLGVTAAMLIAVYLLAGVSEAIKSFGIQSQLGSVAAPYATTVSPLANWVDAHTSPAAPIVLYGVDALLYRVLAHPPPRPWVPQLTWILSARDSEARWWDGVVRERPDVALVAATWWDSGPAASNEPSAGWLRANYHADSRFALIPYPGAQPVSIVALELNNTVP